MVVNAIVTKSKLNSSIGLCEVMKKSYEISSDRLMKMHNKDE